MAIELDASLEIEVERLAAGGDGVGHVDGRVVFIPLTAPGDRVRAVVRELKRRYARAELVEVLRPAASRRSPPCPYFGRCGGCTWMHIAEDEQARARESILRDALERIGRLEVPASIEWIPSPAALGYRCRARVAVDEGRVGFRARRSHQVLDVERCLVLDPETQRALERVRAEPPSGSRELEIRGFDRALGLRVGRGAFFQANRPLWARWQQAVVEACGGGETAVELYAGVGFYTVGLVQSFARVTAVERGRAARDLGQNLRAFAGAARALVVRAAAEDFAPRALARLRPDVVLLNPPRTGCLPSVIDALRRAQPARVVYVSCDPATLARDIARLDGDYGVQRVVAIGALPQTHHVEAFVVLSGVDSSSEGPIESGGEGGEHRGRRGGAET